MGLGRPSGAGRARGAINDGLDACSRGGSEQRTEPRSRGRSPCPGRPPGTCHQLKAPRHGHNGTVGASHVPSLRSSCHTRKQPSETPVRQHQGCTRAPEAQRTRRSALRIQASALSWSSDGCADGQAVCASLLGAQWPEQGGREGEGLRAEVGGAALEQPPDRTELLGNLPGPSWCPRRAGRGGRAPGRQALSGCGWK